MIILRNLVLILSFIVFYGCSNIPGLGDLASALPDKQTAYQKSRGMPTLEIPPDLTVTEGEYAADIPGEESTSLSEFQRQRAQNKRQGSVLGSGEADGEQWLALRGSSYDIWPKLHEFWDEKGYVIDLDDAELGVLETDWKEIDSSRHKFKIFTEPNEAGGTILFLSSEREELSEGEWLEALADTTQEKNVIRKINLHFYGTEVPNVSSSTSSSSSSSSRSASATPEPEKPKAEVLDVGDGKSYLTIPQEFSRAWREAKMVVERAGYLIEASDQEKGLYDFRYFMPEGEEEEKGLLSKLKFWGDDEDEGKLYQLSLTGVGDKTEIIVMNKDGEWETGEDAKVILETLKENYNKL
jgi:outer membrane protein assembly factor BamC